MYPNFSPSSNRLAFLSNEAIANDSIRNSQYFDSAPYSMSKSNPELALAQSEWPAPAAGANEYLLRLVGSGTKRLTLTLLWVSNDNTTKIPVDSAIVTVKDIHKLYTVASSRLPYTTPTVPYFLYPGEDGRKTVIPIFPNKVEQDNHDKEVKKTLVFVHGYWVSKAKAIESFNATFKRVFWQGFRGNFVGFNWRGDEKAPLFDPNVKNAFYTSPALWAFLRNTLENDVESGGWGLSPSDVDIAAHSLGNLVMWGALRINEQKTADKLVNNVSSIEAAIWKEAFDPENNFNYYTAYENLGTFTPDQQKQSSWRFWFNAAGHDPRESIAGGVYHTFNHLDSSLGKMQLNDSILRGQTDRSGWFQQPPVYRSALNLSKIPTFVRPDAVGFDHLETHLYAANELNVPIGAVENPLATQNFDASTLGWDSESHSDFLLKAYPNVFRWYRTTLAETSAIAIGKE